MSESELNVQSAESENSGNTNFFGDMVNWASGNGRAAPKIPAWELPIDQARDKVVVKNSDKVLASDGAQNLTLIFSRRRLALDAVAPGAVRIHAPGGLVEDFTKRLMDGVAAGLFDEAIKAAQEALEATANKRKARPKETPMQANEAAASQPPMINGGPTLVGEVDLSGV